MSIPHSQWRAISEPEVAPQLSPAPLPDPRFLLLAEIERLIVKAQESDLKQVVSVLGLARLELKMAIYNVSESELRTLGMVACSELSIEDVLS